MPSRVTPGPVQGDACIREAVCVHTKKIFDSCKDKDCVDSLRMYPTCSSKPILDNAVSLRPRSATLLFAAVDVEEVTFNRGYYTVDVRYFYKIRGDAYNLANCPAQVTGLAIFDKRVILFGSEGNAKIFTSGTVLDGRDIPLPPGTNLPHAVVEAVDPILLSMKLIDGCALPADGDGLEVPERIRCCFEEPLTTDGNGRIVEVTIGQFSIIRLERDTQLLIPAYDYCMPDKECEGGGEDDPCSLFSRIHFPVDEFFPPDTISMPECYRDACATLEK